MYELDQKYIDALEQCAEEIQNAEELQLYLEEEEESYYLQLKERFEPVIGQIYEEVAAKDPLQLIGLETILLDPLFEGLFLPKILGYSVLRGEVDVSCKYLMPQDHFKQILLAICESANFDILRKRIGQSIQMGFALSSDIWVTNLINSIENKRVRYFLQSQKLDKYRRDTERWTGYNRFKRQFVHDNYQSADFPGTVAELKLLYIHLKNFLLYRVQQKLDNTSIIPHLHEFATNAALHETKEFLHILMIYASYFELDASKQSEVKVILVKLKKELPDFEELFLEFLLELHQEQGQLNDATADLRMASFIDLSSGDLLAEYYNLVRLIHQKGYTNDEVHQTIKDFYNKHEGLSTVNECLRQTILHYFKAFIPNLEARDYPELFEISKLFSIYIHLFVNQKFAQDIKEMCMDYVAVLLKHFTDKRGKDYQDIKKFVSTTFMDLGFLKEKEIVELFKTRRKKKVEE